MKTKETKPTRPLSARTTSGRRSRCQLDEADAWLMVYVTEACQRQCCFDFVQEVRELARSDRRKIFAILQAINCPEPGQPELWQLQARLVDAVCAAGGSREVADAFILPPDEWKRRHVVSLPSIATMVEHLAQTEPQLYATIADRISSAYLDHRPPRKAA